MYLPKLFAERDVDRVHAFIETHGFGVLVVAGADGGPEIAHVPFLLDRTPSPRGRLRVHVARANPIWKASIAARAVTVVFPGPHGYVSPRWYENRREQVPTWNYMAVHARGRAEGPADRDESLAFLSDLAAAHESGAASPWSPGELDSRLRDELLAEIVVFAIAIDELEGKFKLSQNRSPEDRARVLRALEERGRDDDLEMASFMARLPKET